MTTATTLNRRKWNTYRETGFMYQVGDDRRATGGRHLHQVRQSQDGNWQTRVVDSNGHFQSAGETTPVDAATGESLYAIAASR